MNVDILIALIIANIWFASSVESKAFKTVAGFLWFSIWLFAVWSEA